MKMGLPNPSRNLGARETEAIGTSRAFCFNDPKRELRQFFFHIGRVESGEVEICDSFRFSCELFCHQRLPPGDGFPIDVTLRFAGHVRAHSRKIVAFSKVRQWLAVTSVHEAFREMGVSSRLGIDKIALRRRKPP